MDSLAKPLAQSTIYAAGIESIPVESSILPWRLLTARERAAADHSADAHPDTGTEGQATEGQN
jgi:hypothetical protein